MKLKLLDGIYCALSYKMHGGHPGILPDDTRDLLAIVLLMYIFDIAIFLGPFFEIISFKSFSYIFVSSPIIPILWCLYIKKNRDRIFEESDRYNTKGYRILSVLFTASAFGIPLLYCTNTQFLN